MDTKVLYIIFVFLFLCCLLSLGGSSSEGFSEGQQVLSNPGNDPNANYSAIGDAIANENNEFNANTDPDNPFRSQLAYGVVLQDPYIRADNNTAPLIYYNRHLTEKRMQDIDYVPRRIRPPRGPFFWQDNRDNPMKKIFDENNVPYPLRWSIARRLNMPSNFY